VFQRPVPTRTLPDRPNLDQLKRQAKELLAAFQHGNASAAKEVHAHYRGADQAGFALHDAQLVFARAHGFDSWPKLKAFVNGVTVRRLVDAIRTGDLADVQSMVSARPELVHLDVAENDEHRALHHAVLQRRPEIVRFLMQHGADARKGIWPHREATTAYTLAVERDYREIARIIEEEEQRRADPPRISTVPPSLTAELVEAFRRNDEDGMIAALEAHPSLLALTSPTGRTALHWAAARLWPKLATWLLARGADASARAKDGATPMDIVGSDPGVEAPAKRAEALELMTTLLRRHGAVKTAQAAIATGDVEWLRARSQEGVIVDGAGLVSLAVAVNKPEMLALLLQLGLDPDEAGRVPGLEEVVPTWGEPLRASAIAGNLEVAEMLLAHGAKANTNVYAATSALFEAYKQHDDRLIALLEGHGARLNPVGVAELGLLEHAARWLADDARARAVGAADNETDVARDLLWGAMGCPEIVRLVLESVDWPREDPRWHGILENGLYLGPASDRPRHLEAFRLVLDRSDPDVPSRRGTTILHEVAASRGGLTATDRTAYATLLLDRGARLDIRDTLLESTPLGWACRWGRVEMVQLLLERGADPVEADAPPWASPAAWAKKGGRRDVAAILEKSVRRDLR
jgi:ankyrin repeat protein